MSGAAPAPSSADSPVAWRMLAALAVAELLGMSLWFSATAVTPSLAEAFVLSASETAWLTMAVQAGFVVATLGTAMANLADVVNPRLLIGVGCLLGAVANAAALAVGSPWALIATRLATGAALAWVYPPAMKVAAGWFRHPARLRPGHADRRAHARQGHAAPGDGDLRFGVAHADRRSPRPWRCSAACSP